MPRILGFNTVNNAIVNADVNAAAAIAGSKIVAATGSVAGVVSTGAQTFTGAKTFSSDMQLDTRLSVGGGVSPSVRLNNPGSITGGTTSYGYYGQHTVQSDVTSNAFGVRTHLSTAAAAFEVPNLSHFFASRGTIGVGSSITSQYGFYVAGNVTGATNNYAFRSDIVAGTGRWNLYMHGTAQNYLAGKLLIGIATALTVDGNVQSAVATATISAFTSNTFTTASRTHYRLSVSDVEVGGIGTVGTSMTLLTGAAERLRIDENGNVGIATTTPTEKLDVVGNVKISGDIGIGGVSTLARLNITKQITGTGEAFGVLINTSVNDAATTNAQGFRSAIGISTGSTPTSLYHFRAHQGTFSGTATAQYGFYVSSNLIGATNNFGFRSDIAAGAGRWNLYMGGSAQNYLAGNLGLGVTVPTEKLDVVGNVKISGTLRADGGFDTTGGGGLATGSVAGLVSTGTQTFGGRKNLENGFKVGGDAGLIFATVIDTGVTVSGTFDTGFTLPASGNYMAEAVHRINTTGEAIQGIQYRDNANQTFGIKITAYSGTLSLGGTPGNNLTIVTSGLSGIMSSQRVLIKVYSM